MMNQSISKFRFLIIVALLWPVIPFNTVEVQAQITERKKRIRPIQITNRRYAILFDVESGRFKDVYDISTIYNNISTFKKELGVYDKENLKKVKLGAYVPKEFTFYDADEVYLLLDNATFEKRYSVVTTISDNPIVRSDILDLDKAATLKPIKLPATLASALPIISLQASDGKNVNGGFGEQILDEKVKFEKIIVGKKYKADIIVNDSDAKRIDDIKNILESFNTSITKEVLSLTNDVKELYAKPVSKDIEGYNQNRQKMDQILEKYELLDKQISYLYEEMDEFKQFVETEAVKSKIQEWQFFAEFSHFLKNPIFNQDITLNDITALKDIRFIQSLLINVDQKNSGNFVANLNVLRMNKDNLIKAFDRADEIVKKLEDIRIWPKNIDIISLNFYMESAIHKINHLAKFTSADLLPEEPLLIASRLNGFKSAEFEIQISPRFSDIKFEKLEIGHSPRNVPVATQPGLATPPQTEQRPAEKPKPVDESNGSSKKNKVDEVPKNNQSDKLGQAENPNNKNQQNSAQPLTPPDQMNQTKSITIAKGFIEFRKTYRFRLSGGFVFSSLRSQTFGTATGMRDKLDSNGKVILDNTGKSVTEQYAFITQTQDRKNILVPVLNLVFYPMGKDLSRDAYGIRKAQSWLPGLIFSLSLSKPTDDFLLGLSFEPTAGMDINFGKHFGLRQRLDSKFKVGEEIPVGRPVPTQEELKNDWFFGISFDLNTYKSLLGGLLGLGN